MQSKLKDIFLFLIAIGMLVGAFFISNDKTATVEKVLIGFSYTIVFFILIEHIPNRIRQQRYAALIEQELLLCLSIITNIREALKIDKKNVKKKTQSLITNRPQPITAKLVHEAPLSAEIQSVQTVKFQSVGAFLELSQKKIKQVKRRLEKFTFFVESELIEIIIDIEKFHLSRSNEVLKNSDTPIALEEILPEFEHLLMLEEKLTGYLEKNQK